MSKQLQRTTELDDASVAQSMSELEIDHERLSNFNSQIRKRVDPVDMGKQRGRLDEPKSSFMATALEREAAIELGQEELTLDPHKSFGAQSHENRTDVGHVSMKKSIGRPKLKKRQVEEMRAQAKAAAKYDAAKSEKGVRPRLKNFVKFDTQPERGLHLEVIDERDEFFEAKEGDRLKLSPKLDVLRPERLGGKWADPPPRIIKRQGSTKQQGSKNAEDAKEVADSKYGSHGKRRDDLDFKQPSDVK